MKNKKGFTLVELLVVIVLVISITTIAVISVTSISKKNKENAYELVKEQIENAADEYFYNNEYLFEGLTDKAEGYISVGRLVEEGLLNTVVDPRTGEKINECALVKVTKENGVFNIKFDDIIDKDNCDNNKYVVIVNPEPEKYEDPIIEFSVNNTLPNSSWYRNINNVTVEIKVDKKTTIDYLSRGTEELSNSNYGTPALEGIYNKYTINETSIYKNDGEYSIRYDVYDSVGVYESNTLNLKVDGTPPTCYIEDSDNVIFFPGASGNYVKGSNINFSIDASDNLSGVCSKKFNNNNSTTISLSSLTSGQKLNATTTDCAGNNNTNNCSATIYITNPVTTTTTTTTTTQALNCNKVQITYSPSSPGANGWYKVDKVTLTIKPPSNVSYWHWYTNLSDGTFKRYPETGSPDRYGTGTVTLSQASFARRGMVRIFNSKGDYITCETEPLKIDGTVDKPKINLNYTSQTSNNVTFTLSHNGDKQSGINRLEYSYNQSTWYKYENKAVTLLNYTGSRTVYARAIDNAGNISGVVSATGKCNKDGVSVAQSAKGCNFSLSLSLPNKPSGVTSGKYEYAVWGKTITSDTSNKQSGLVSSKCGNVPKSGATIYTVNNSVTKTISMLKNTQYMYYCFAVRPYRSTEITSINRWTVQYKHAKLEDGVCN